MNEIESIDRRIHPAKVILYKIKNFIFNLIWPEIVYGVDREVVTISYIDDKEAKHHLNDIIEEYDDLFKKLSENESVS